MGCFSLSRKDISGTLLLKLQLDPSLLFGDFQEAVMLFGFVFVIMGITFYQQNQRTYWVFLKVNALEPGSVI